MGELIDEIAGGDHVVLPLERFGALHREGNRLDLDGYGRPCHVESRPMFHQLLSTGSSFRGTTFAELEADMVLSLNVLSPTAFRVQLARSAGCLHR